MPWGAAIGAVGAIAGGVIGSNGAKSAANAQAKGAEAATAEQRREFDYLQGIYQPGRNLGYGADAMLAQLFGMSNPLTSSYSFDPMPGSGGGGGGGGGGWDGPQHFMGGRGGDGMPGMRVATGSTTAGPHGTPGAPGASGHPDYSSFFNSPGYGFALQQGQQAINRGASARGNLYAPNTLMDLNNYAQGQASTRYNDYVNQLLQMAGLGGAAVSGTAQAGATGAANIGAGLMSQGNANASGALGSANAWSNAINQVGGQNWGKLFNNNPAPATPYQPMDIPDVPALPSIYP